jgi:hypothetical protein
MQEATHNETDETEQDAWMPLAAVNTRLVNKVLGTPFGKAVTAAELPATPADKDGEGAENGSGSKKNERRDAEHREAVDERLRSLRAFEDRASGRTIKRRI